MVQIYSTHSSERLNYILNYVFKERFGIPFTLSTDTENLENTGGLRINYSEEVIPGSLQIIPQGILSESSVRYLVFDLSDQDDSMASLLDKSENRLHFDIFSAIFYLVSRYEEYLMFPKDKHHRFRHEDSSLFRGSCLHLPLVDIWVSKFKTVLIEDFGLSRDSFAQNRFTVKPTLDIDSVFAYRGRPFLRHLTGICRNLALLQFGEIAKRLRVIWLGEQDPNDNFDFQLQALSEKGIQAHYFFQVGPYGPYDKNIHPGNKDFINTILKIKAAGHSIGLHPSYQSNGDPASIKVEKDILEGILQTEVTTSRQHFLRVELPKTYRSLIECGIREDYSMGYSEVNGFKAGTAFPFYWFDIEQNKTTELRIIPFCMMDVAYKQFGKVDADETIEKSKGMIETLKSLGAPFFFVFHNESLSEHRGWQGWRNVFKFWLNG